MMRGTMLFLGLAVFACGPTGDDSGGEDAEVVGLEISPADAMLVVTDGVAAQQTYTLMARFDDGTITDVTADAAFGMPGSELTSGAAWLGVFAYSIQIYFDFSGYSDMAIGMARIFGFVIPENFRRPYSALSITDYWRRWHITLSSWFRDYVYLRLGGWRGSR